MHLKRMRKVTVYADSAQRELVLRELEEMGLTFYHVLECISSGYGSDNESKQNIQDIQIEMLVDASDAGQILRDFNDHGVRLDSSRISVSEVFASPTYNCSQERRSSPPREVKWGDYLITV